MGFGADDRAVSNVVGATLIFGFLVLFLALYQASVVPSQNEQVEFDHSQTVQRDVLEARNAIVQSAESGLDGFVTVTLGTSYPPRTIAINPPPVTGTLRTTPNQSFVVKDAARTDVTGQVCPGEPVTRFLVYEPNYNVYTSGPDVVYENSVVYEAFGTGDVFASGQRLVSGDQVTVVPLQRPYSKSGRKSVALDSIAGTENVTAVTDPAIELPTRLSNESWVELLDGEVPAGAIDVTNGVLNVTLTGDYDVVCRPVGVDDVPTGGAADPGSPSLAPPEPGVLRQP